MDYFIIVLGCLLCAFACAIAAYGIGAADATNAIYECEKNLPRNQHCEIYAKPAATEE